MATEECVNDALRIFCSHEGFPVYFQLVLGPTFIEENKRSYMYFGNEDLSYIILLEWQCANKKIYVKVKGGPVAACFGEED